MKTLTKRSSSILLVALLGTAAVTVAATGGSGEGGSGDAPLADFEAPSFTMDGEIEVLLLRLGMSKEAVAAAGISAGQLQGLLAASQDSLSSDSFGGQGGIGALPEQLAELDAEFASAKREMDSLRRTVQSGLATDEEIAQLQVAKQAHETAEAARQAFLDGVCMALCSQLPEDQSAVFMQVCQNKQWKGLPVQYRAADRSQAEWVAIRRALASKRTHEEMGEEVPASALAVLAEHDSEPAVATAQACCNAELAGVEATWDAIFNE